MPDEIAEKLSEDIENVLEGVRELGETGTLFTTRKGKLALPDQLGLIHGKVQVNPRGFGFLLPTEGGEDLFIPRDCLNGAMHNDLVWARRTEAGYGSESDRGEVASIISRGCNHIVGTFENNGGFGGYVIPDDSRIFEDMLIPASNVKGAEHSDKVVAEILHYPDGRRPMIGKITEVLGKAGEKGVDILSVIRTLDLPDEFSKAAKKLAKDIAVPPAEQDFEGRTDFRDKLIITIDGADAKDLDDAVSLEMKNGNYLLGVHIADVSHYVKENGAIDKDAYRRGTSVYFPDRVLPMLPRELSNGVCSLNPNENKLTLSCIMEIDGEGTVVNHKICESVIRSAYRMTYEDVNAIFAGDELLRGKYREILPLLDNMRTLMGILNAKRVKRGSIDFDLAEARITLDSQGRAAEVEVHERGEAHRMIEEFMLSANETVARHALEAKLPLMYRVHEPPAEDRIRELNTFLNTLGYNIKNPANLRPISVQKVIERAKGTDEETVVSRVALRAMSKAKYSPECLGHFGLAMSAYCHFTSPIRRYPDLTVHRALKEMLHNKLTSKRRAKWMSYLEEASKHCSERELAAVEAERTVDDLKKCEYMQFHLEEEFDAVVSGVAQYGMFVELKNTVEGLVRSASMMDDYYICDEKNYRMVGKRTGKQYRLGDPVRVKAVTADMESGNVDFELCGVKPRKKEHKKAEKPIKRIKGRSTKGKKNGKIVPHRKGSVRSGSSKRSAKAGGKPKGKA